MNEKNQLALGELRASIMNSLEELGMAEQYFKDMTEKPSNLEEDIVNNLPAIIKKAEELNSKLHEHMMTHDADYKQMIDDNPF